MKKIWKVINGFEDYEVSNYGQVRKIRGYNSGELMSPRKRKDGYLQIGLRKNKKRDFKLIHRLVLENFDLRKDMDKLQCNHKNGIKNENIYPENIKWCTPSENIRHAIESGLMNNKGENHSMYGKHPSEETRRLMRENHADVKGESHPRSILTEKDIIEIRIDLKKGILNQREIAKKFGVSRITISNIKCEKTWTHIKL